MHILRHHFVLIMLILPRMYFGDITSASMLAAIARPPILFCYNCIK